MATNELQYEAKVEQTSEIERRLAVEVPWTEVKGRLDEAYRELSRGVSVKGFRRGKVPRKMLEKLFRQHVDQEVAQRLVQDSIVKVMTDKELAPVAEPEVENKGIVDGEAFCYSATLQVVPEIEPKDYFGIDVIQRPAKVDDADVEKALEEKRYQQIEYKDIEGRNTADGDVLLVDIMGKIGDAPYDQENQLVEIKEGGQEPVVGLAEKLTGIEPKPQELDVELDVNGEKARLLVTVKDVKEKVVPEFDDAFAKNTGEAETIKELKEKLHKDLMEMDEKRAKSEAQDRLIEAIVEKNNVPSVPALVEQHLERVIRMQSAMIGIDPSQALGDEDIRDRLRDDAEKTVRGAMMIGAIAKKENIEVDDAELEKKLAEFAAQRGDNVAKVRSEYEKDGRIEQIKGTVREEKTLDLLMSKANIEIKEIPEEKDASADLDGDAKPAEDK